ncbi:MAG: hypothetical protein GYB68_14315 [Chloroflexi bacterium]|nr:hypothetical protein [Chloroflexota bacterium]
MIHRRSILVLLIVLSMLGTAACRSAPQPPDRVSSPTSTRETAPTEAPATQVDATAPASPAPSPSQTPTTFPLDPPPARDFFDTAVADDFLFSPTDVANCNLPCWQGLRVGASSTQAVQAVFSDQLGLGPLDLIRDNPVRGRYNYRDDVPEAIPPDGYLITGQEWRFFGPDLDFAAYALLNLSTDRLASLSFVWRFGAYRVPTVQRAVDELGPPDQILTFALSQLIPEDVSKLQSVPLVLVYDEGMLLSFNLPQSERPDGRFEVCLNELPLFGSVHLTEPISDLADLTTTQAATFGWLLNGRNQILGDLPTELRISLDAATQAIESGGCLLRRDP